MTPQQQAAYDYIRDMLTEIGEAPTLQEISDRLALFSRTIARQLVDDLVAAGWLVRTGARERNIALADTASVDLTAVATGALQAELARRDRPFRVPYRAPTRFTRPCGAAGCQERVTRGKLLCRDHWFALPERLRHELVHYQRAGQVASYQDAWRRASDLLEATPL